ncbi:Thiamine biosynthetic bifunctional enzyme TH1, chloroplastic-like protein [Drosera capensis]
MVQQPASENFRESLPSLPVILTSLLTPLSIRSSSPMFSLRLQILNSPYQANSAVRLRRRRTLLRGSCIKASMSLSTEDGDGKLEPKRIAHVMTVAGSDSGGGAGIQADLKTCAARRVYCSTIITAVTAQNTVGVQGVSMMAEEFVAEQMKSVLSDMQVDMVKTGMLPSIGITKVLLDCISQFPVRALVVDPVMVSTSGDELAGSSVLPVFRNI